MLLMVPDPALYDPFNVYFLYEAGRFPIENAELWVDMENVNPRIDYPNATAAVGNFTSPNLSVAGTSQLPRLS
jgi:hypothetical protein